VAGTSVASITTAARLAKRVFNDHFANKEAALSSCSASSERSVSVPPSTPRTLPWSSGIGLNGNMSSRWP